MASVDEVQWPNGQKQYVVQLGPEDGPIAWAINRAGIAKRTFDDPEEAEGVARQINTFKYYPIPTS